MDIGQYNLLNGFSSVLSYPFYLLDWENKEILYATGNPYFIGKYTADEMMTKGEGCLFDMVRSDESDYLRNVSTEIYNFYSQLEVEDKSEYVASYNCSVRVTSDFFIKVNCQVVLLNTDFRKNILLCVLLPGIRSHEGALVVRNKKLNRIWVWKEHDRVWKKYPGEILNDKEKLVMVYAIDGMDISETADAMNKSVETVKDYRTSIIDKLGVKNISEAISVVMVQNLL